VGENHFHVESPLTGAFINSRMAYQVLDIGSGQTGGERYPYTGALFSLTDPLAGLNNNVAVRSSMTSAMKQA